ncbi:Chaperone protein DnaK [uncultured Candidatus Thioglobus sp.]|nr:Chaperone protein DnaK [uncultured Candidatus Thioglobus sp.]
MADSLVHSTKQMMDELKEQVSKDEKTAIDTAISELEEAMKGDDKEAIDAKVQSLNEAAQPLAEKAQAKAGADAGGEGFTDAANAGADNVDNADDVVDADFEEVKDDKKDK